MMLKYYYDLVSQPSRAIFLFLNKTKIPFKKCRVDLGKAAHKEEEYKAIHPFQQVPAIDDGGFKMIESVAILRYLCRAYPDHVADHWYPADVKQQARVDEYLEWQHAHIRFHGSMYFQHKWLLPKLSGEPPKQSSVDRFQAGLETALDHIETIWLKDRSFLAGDQITIADLLGVCEVLQPTMAGYDVFKDRAVLSKWFENVKGQVGPELDQANFVLNKIAANSAIQQAKL
uniref:glutathione transferase n=1 Tax=Hirondellea gigas TaxID=1518452 RepID=A0A2P2HYL9_9CRUS